MGWKNYSHSAKYGNIRDVKTTGASEETAAPDRGTILTTEKGVKASEALAAHDSVPMKKYRQKIYTVAGEKHIHPALIAAIISRESRAGEAIKKTEGWGDWNPVKKKYNAFGLMQVDVDEDGGNHEPEGKWDSVDHLRQATDILIFFIERIQEKCEKWSKEEQLKGGIAAYNMGDGSVDSDDPDKVDKKTTHKDYSNDVVARAQWFIKNGYDD